MSQGVNIFFIPNDIRSNSQFSVCLAQISELAGLWTVMDNVNLAKVSFYVHTHEYNLDVTKKI